MHQQDRYPGLIAMILIAIVVVIASGVYTVVRRTAPADTLQATPSPAPATAVVKGAAGGSEWCEPDSSEGCLPSLCESFERTVVVFHATWCGPCRFYEEHTLADPAVIETVKPFAKVRVDVDKNEVLADRYAVEYVPTTVILDKGCKEVLRLGGAFYPDSLIENIQQLP